MKKENFSNNTYNNSVQENIDSENQDLNNKQISEYLPYLKKEKNNSSNSLDFDIISEEEFKNYSQSLYAKKKNYKTDTKYAINLNDKNPISTKSSAIQHNQNNNSNEINKNCENENSENSEDEAADSKINILKESILLETKQKGEAGMWNSFASKFSNFKNYLKYNVISSNRQLKFSELSYITLFDKSFAHNQFSTSEFNLALAKIFSFTYRTHFSELLPVNGVTHTSDCGWGCMIRAGQMMLSKAVLEFKLFQLGKEILISQEDIFDVKINVLKLFFDNLISFEEKEFLDETDFAFFFRNFMKILNAEEKKFKEFNNTSMKFSENICCEEDFQNNFSQNGLTVKGVFAPFSVQNVTKLGILYDAGPGVWFSDAKAIKIFKEIEEQLNVFNSELHIFSFDSGVIYEKDLIEECFEEVKFECIKDYEKCENQNDLGTFKKYSNNEDDDCLDDKGWKFNQENDNDIVNNDSNKKLNYLLQTRISTSDYDKDNFEEEININLPKENDLYKNNFTEKNSISNTENNYICEGICTKCLEQLNLNNKQAFKSEIIEIDFYNSESENEKKKNSNSNSNKTNFNLNNKEINSSNHQIITKKFFKVKKCGFIFVSVRHGLHSIEKEYHRSIKQFFKIPYNLGIIGGKANSAFYFVGEHQERLIYLDPHLSQKAVENLSVLYQSGYESYDPKYFYYLDIKNMSPGFTMGFYFRNVEEYKELKNALNVHSESKFNLFSFEKLGENKKFKKKASVKKPEEMKFTEVMEDDFSVIDIEDDF